MKHKKIQHEEKINICWNYPSGNCEFRSDNGWFLHKDRSETKFECNNCKKTFENMEMRYVGLTMLIKKIVLKMKIIRKLI